MTSTDSKPTITVAHNLGFTVDLYDVFNPDASTKGPLTYTHLATVPSGASAVRVNTLRFASQLQAMRTGSITALNNNYYTQFPVAVLVVSPFSPSLAFTLTEDMQEGMEQSFKFLKYSQANSSSQMTTKFCTALSDTKSQRDAVDKFFKGTQSFQKCTMSTWTAVCSWQAQFTSPWQGTYYLYSVVSPPALVATLAIVVGQQASSATLTMAGTSQSTEVVMTGDGTMQEKDQGTGNLSVSLTPAWLNIAQTSKQDNKTVTNYLIGASFGGTINGAKVAGNLNQMAIPDSSDTSKNAKAKGSANFFSVDSLEGLVGIVTSVGMLYYMAKGHKQAETQKENNLQKGSTSESDANAKKAQVEADYQRNDVPQVETQSKAVQTKDVPKVQDAYKQVDQATDIQFKQSVVEGQAMELQDLLEEGAPSQATEDAAIDLSKASDRLEKAADPSTTVADRDKAVEDIATILTGTSTKLDTELQKQGVERSAEETQALENTEKAIKEQQDQADSMKENQKRQEEKEKNDGNQELKEEDFKDPKVEKPAEYRPPREIGRI